MKVDREERPDVDGVYMQAVQALTGHGGWPLNVFLTPEQTPFFGGTYWPPVRRHGMPAFAEVLTGVAEMWRTRRDDALAAGAQLTEHLRAQAQRDAPAGSLRGELLERAIARLREDYDDEHGGFGGAPKFPPHCVLDLLLARGELEPALGTLRAMARGGIHDQVGGGFARYAVDRTWTVPHFEEEDALRQRAAPLAATLHALAAERRAELLLRTARETLDFCACLRELRAPDAGGFYCFAGRGRGRGRGLLLRLDGGRAARGPRATRSGRDRVLRRQRSRELRGRERAARRRPGACRARADQGAALRRARAMLAAARALDDKQVASWNALAIRSARFQAGAALEDEVYLDAARAAADHVWARMRDGDGRLLRTPEGVTGFLEDNAFMLEAFLSLYEATFEERHFERAVELAEALIARFADEQRGGFYFGARDGEVLIAARKEIEDHPIPAGASSAALGLLRLAALSGEARYEQAAVGALSLSADLASRFPSAFAYLLCALDFHLADVLEVALAGEHIDAFARVVRAAFRPHLVLAASGPLLEGRSEGAYVCRRFACEAPVHDADGLARALTTASGARPKEAGSGPAPTA